MTLRWLRILVLSGAIALIGAHPVAAQIDSNLGGLTTDNVKGYLGPLPDALSTTLNSATWQSAHIPTAGLTLSLGIHAMAVTFGDDDRTYIPTDPPGFSSTGPQPVPTVVGDENATPVSGQGGSTLYYPGGLNLDQFTAAVPQLNIGTIAGTNALVRFIAFETGDSDLGRFELYGFGAQHSISQYFKGLPVDIALGALYQRMKLGDDDLVDANTFHAEVMASKGFAWVQPYASLGFDSFGMKVKYDQSSSPGAKTEVEFDDTSNVHFTGGVLLGFPMVKLHAEFDVGAKTGGAIGLRVGV